MSVVDDIKSRLDIVETISDYITLEKAGRNFKAPCPFHIEKTPSFVVNPERQGWRCFGACSTGGDAFSFVMRIEPADFGTALRILAKKVGLEISSRSKGESSKIETIYQINSITANFFQEVLNSSTGEQASVYLDERGVTAKARAKFMLGMSPPKWEGLKNHLLELGVSLDDAVRAGVLHIGNDGRTRDFFRGRLMFPIYNKQGKVLGFGARTLDNSNPKYINTASRPSFDKRSILYGLHLASQSIKEQNTGILVEGYMDVIAAHQHGFTNVVASMGTALTAQQVAQLKPLTKTFVLAMDPDIAGQEATLRSLESSWRVMGNQSGDTFPNVTSVLHQREPLTLKIAALPLNQDPDTLIRNDPGAWQRLVLDALPLLDYLIPTVAARFDLSTGIGKSQAAELLIPVIRSANFFDQDRYMRKLAETLNVTVATLKASMGQLNNRKASRGNRRRTERPTSSKIGISSIQSNPKNSLEEHMLALLLARPELKDHVLDLNTEYFNETGTREVFTRWLTCSTMDDLRDSLDESLHEQLMYLIKKELVPAGAAESEAALQQCVQRLERRHLQELQEQLLMSADIDIPPPKEIENQIASVNARLRELFT